MKHVVFLCLMTAFVGCAHRTVHQECSDAQTAAKYRDYDQCYAERSQEKAERLAAWRARMAPKKTVSCTSRNLAGIVQTDCE